MSEKLTEHKIARTHTPASGQVMIWDNQVRGLGVRILASGSKTWWFMYRPPGGRSVNSRMVRIGTFPAVALADARKRARALAGAVAHGHNPAQERAEEKRR